MKPAKAAWLASTHEDPIDASRAIVDPHHHLWHRSGSKYLFDDLQADTGAGHRVVATVFVECLAGYRSDGPVRLQPVGETEFVASQARLARSTGGASISAIVAHADLTLGPAVEEVLCAHEAAGEGLFRGIRHPMAHDPEIGPGHVPAPAGMMDTPAFRAGLATLGRLGYSFDAWLFHPQLPDLVRLMRDHPDVPVVLDHLGAPLGVARFAGRREAVRESWRAAIRELAECPNVLMKVGGIGMNRYLGGGWPSLSAPPTSQQLYEYWRDDIRWCIDQFSPQRCMFESNFPVDRESCSYTVLWNTYQRIGQHYSTTECDALFHDTAARFYRLDAGASPARALRESSNQPAANG